MKITSPRYKKEIKGASGNALYAVICQFKGGEWGFASFWGLPYTADRYIEASVLRRVIVLRASRYNYWNDKQFRVVKIEL